jgi:hypothetical protein
VALLLALLVPAAASAEVRFGSWTPGDPYHGTTHGQDALQAATGRHVDIVNWYQSWGGGSWVSAVQQQALQAVTSKGRTPLLTWEPWEPTGSPNQPKYALARIAGGDFDVYLTTWALALKLNGSPVYLRPMHEFNSDWYPWSGAANGNTPAQFVQAWRHIHDIFRNLGASNVRFVWSPNNIDVPASNPMESFYPGDAYVDVLAVDGYNWGAGTPAFGGWQSFSEVFARAYDRLSALGPQPIWIAEVGSSADGGDKAAWIRDMFARAAEMSRLEAIVWFNENKERDWSATPTPEIAAAFAPGASGIAAPSHTAKPRLRLRLARTPRPGGRAVVRWSATGASKVTRWHAYLNGRRVKSVARTQARVAHKRITRPGRYRWRVVGRNADGRRIVSATRIFRVTG